MKKNKILIFILSTLLVIISFMFVIETISFKKTLSAAKEIQGSISNEIIVQAEKSVVTIVSGINIDNGLRTGNVVVGTGLVYNKEKGHVVTNYHVIKGGNFYVITSDNLAHKANLISYDEKMDIAVIEVENANLTEARFGNSKKCKIGEKVYAIGTPLSPTLKNTFFDGIISGIDRTGLSEYKLIQSNIASNPGLSGSPLINSKGEVIGINTFESTEFGSQGLTFSIPAEDVIFALSELESNSKLSEPYLGLEIKENPYPNYGISDMSGVIIQNVYSNSPAEKADLKVNDKIISINGIKVDNKTDYNEIIKTIKLGDEPKLLIMRNNDKIIKNIKINEMK